MNRIIKNAKIVVSLIPRRVCIYQINNVQIKFRWTWLKPVQKVRKTDNKIYYYTLHLISR